MPSVFPWSYDNASGGLMKERKNSGLILFRVLAKFLYCNLNLQKQEKKVPQFSISGWGGGGLKRGFFVRAGSDRPEAQIPNYYEKVTSSPS